MKAAFLDRDGTIVSEYPDESWPSVTEPEFLAGAVDGLKRLQELDFRLIIITNQCLINEGLITHAQYRDFTSKMLEVLGRSGISVLAIFFCPHRADEACGCMKPRPGMIEAALSRYPAIDLAQSFLAGDRVSDMELARCTGLRAFGIRLDHPGCTKVASLKDIPALLESKQGRVE